MQTAPRAESAPLRSRIRLLGRILGDTIAEAEGGPVLQRVESIRRLAKAARHADPNGHRELFETLQRLDDVALLPVARSFSHFLNLVNIIEQHEGNREAGDPFREGLPEIDACLDALLAAGHERGALEQAVRALDIDLVLTPHPTEITRRTLIDKHVQ